MAISKILHMNDCGKTFHGKHLKAALDYIMVPEKTQNGRLVSAVNCLPEYAYEQMEGTKRHFGKTDKRQGYHLILSFPEGEADPDMVFELTQKFVDAYLHDEYEAVFAVHDNTKHLHSHIIFNSVSFKEGRKFHYKKGDWERYIQPITNRLCEEYGLSTIELETGTEEQEDFLHEKGEKEMLRGSRNAWSAMVRRDVDACILFAHSYEEFLFLLESKGYELKNAHGEGKYFSLKLPGMKRVLRVKTLGEDYTEENIKRRIDNETLSSHVEDNEKTAPRIVYCKMKRCKRAKLTGLQKKYFAKLYRTGRLKKRPYSEVWKYKEAIKQMHRLQEQYLFLVRHHIYSPLQLAAVTDELAERSREVSAQRKKLHKADFSNKELYETAEKMKMLIECEHAYQNGDHYFIEEHERYAGLQAELYRAGYTYEEVVKIREHYHQELKKCRELSIAVSKEVRIAKSIREEQEQAGKEIPTEQIKIQTEQPKR